MSRYELPGKQPDTLVAVGWDHPLLTFFLQVYEGRSGNPRLWLGARPGELYRLADLRKVAARLVDIPAELQARLHADRDEGR